MKTFYEANRQFMLNQLDTLVASINCHKDVARLAISMHCEADNPEDYYKRELVGNRHSEDLKKQRNNKTI
jgi:hypothetical protein